MTYHHILVRKESGFTNETLFFKDLSEQELRTPFLVRFISDAHNAGEPDGIHVAPIRARIIRTERTHDEEVDDYLRDYWQKAEEFMQLSGQHISSEPLGDSAIAGAGKDITAEFLRAYSSLSRRESA